LALVKDGRKRIGSTLYVPMERRSVPIEIVSPVFFDPEGARLRG
jgi:sarcosine oxidase subunit alpha